jgi:LuxR family maltose regulon positive regulatory protein
LAGLAAMPRFSSFSQVKRFKLLAMTMTFSIHESIDPNGAFEMIFNSHPAPEAPHEDRPIVREKLRIPKIEGFVERPRITNLLTRSTDQFPATLVSGRSGTGKTAIAALFAAEHDRVAWYSVESTDVVWPVFSRYFSAALRRAGMALSLTETVSETRSPSKNDIARYLGSIFCFADGSPRELPSLIVLDDIHHLFDAHWFGDFFNLLLYSLPAGSHLLMLCRSRPPGPVWRLRSKQMLNVLDEKVIAFDLQETRALFASLGMPASVAERAHRDSFGRVAKLIGSA